MDNFFKVNLDNYDYPLTEDKIARFPLEERDRSRLLVYKKGRISHHVFTDIPGLLPDDSLLVFNETRVISARINFIKPSGASIEILLLHPVSPSAVMPVAMNARKRTVWQCMIKNFRKWNDGLTLHLSLNKTTTIKLTAEIEDRNNNLIAFSWEPANLTFSDIIEMVGKTPLPPYMKRDPETVDSNRYQTVYSKNKGAVAAPTAGLHFTDQVIDELRKRGHKTDFITLHVSAGTFQPIREKEIKKHPMHTEQIILSRKNIQQLLNHPDRIIAVGTTSLRTLESIFWYGVKLMRKMEEDLSIEKLFPYQYGKEELPSLKQSLETVLNYMDKRQVAELRGETEIFIFPGYTFRICKGLITNYHVPRSTLILLVAAFTGDDWRLIYDEAIRQEYRFLSYGDSSLLLP